MKHLFAFRKGVLPAVSVATLLAACCLLRAGRSRIAVLPFVRTAGLVMSRRTEAVRSMRIESP